MSSQSSAPRKRVTIHELRRMKAAGEKIAMVTAYDATMARLVGASGADVVLVGDSLGMVVQGHETTLPVTLDHMVYHSAAVRRGLDREGTRAHLVADLPFGSYQASADDAVKSAMRLVAESGAEAVKLEGGQDYAEVVRRIVRAGVPVMGHVGLTPQSIHRIGGYVVQGKDSEKAHRLLHDARALEEAGCYAIVLECIPAELARIVTGQLGVPTIGIGAGPHCDGQVLVVNDLVGLDDAFKPKFVKRFAQAGAAISSAVRDYVGEVKGVQFPADEHSFHSQTLRLVALADAADDRGDDAALNGAPV
jgi:3-methyl-2-oxobutanoate hydroxymethyltransferase